MWWRPTHAWRPTHGQNETSIHSKRPRTAAASFGSEAFFRILLTSLLYTNGTPVENGNAQPMISATVMIAGPSEMSWSNVDGRK